MFLPLYDRNRIAHIDFPYVNYGLIAVTVLVFFIQQAAGPTALDRAHVEFGMIPVVIRDLADNPVPWLPDQATLITYAFLHADWLHLLTNMLFLWVLGDNIEDALGHARYFVFYLLCAVLAALAHLFFFPDSVGPLVGASGAVAGVIGAYLMLYPRAQIVVLMKIVIPLPLPIPAWTVLGLWAIVQFVQAMAGFEDGIAWWAHIGGAAAGALLVIVMKRREVPLFGGKRPN